MEIKDLTLYGRMIYGISCFIKLWDIYCSKEKCNEIKFILNKLCTFTSTDNLSEWENDTLPFTPACIFEAVNESGKFICSPEICSKRRFKHEICEFAKDCNHVKNKKRNNEEQKMFLFYQNIDDDYLNILDILFNVGASELYGTPRDMKETEMFLSNIIDILKKHDVDAPDINGFKEYTLNNPKKTMDYFGVKIDSTKLLDLI
ncbi:hypothetical protein [Acetivibrio cellulolyticus]|uniref:hypothetical protein n=1 Tax=Acetivibrio cellulolyticus TaxID=35830 RepID=UPI0001E2D1BE|nr:hypothetical protein [Acetivibrio cellulolyticus]